MRHRKGSPGQRLRNYLEGHDLAPLNDDIRFVVACLERIPVDAHDWTVSRYAGAWKAAMDAVDEGHAKQNAGRRAANGWVRGVLEHKRLPVPDGVDMKQVRI